jgi:hypothetical protein
LSPSMARFRQKENEILNDPNADFPPVLRAVTDSAYDKLLKRYTPEELDATRLGYQKANEFIRRFVAAGGILKEGSDPPRGMAGTLMHEALVMDVEAGVPPMTAIQAATLNVAKTFHKDRDYGSVEPGKVADLSIIEGDPLKDIWMTQNVKILIMDGKIVDIGFHKYKNPIPAFVPDAAARDRNIAAVGDARHRSDAHGARPRRAADSSGHAQRQGDADALCQARPARSRHSAGRHRRGRHLHRHGEKRGRAIEGIISGSSGGRLQELARDARRRVTIPAG